MVEADFPIVSQGREGLVPVLLLLALALVLSTQ